MLTNCPECNGRVSDKAPTCPHCGFPLLAEKRARRTTQPKRMRLPNGFGQISEIKGRKLRKPFRAMVTVGKSETGRPIVKPLEPVAYFETYNEAYAALVAHSKNPMDVDSNITVEALYKRWLERFKKTASSTTMYETAWRYCGSVKNIPMKDIRAYHIKHCMFEEKALLVERGNVVKSNIPQVAPPRAVPKIRALWKKLFEYAIEYDIVDTNYAEVIKLSDSEYYNPPENTEGHIAFTDEELTILWKNKAAPYVDLILYQCYSGWRPQELINIRLTDVDLKKKVVIGGLKTKAGRNRIVPIHSAVLPIVKRHLEISKRAGSEMLFSFADKEQILPVNYRKYRYEFGKLMAELGLNAGHKPHDARKTFVTLGKRYEMDEWAIKRIVGHSIRDVTEGVYTERSPEWLKKEIEKIKFPN